MEHESLLLPKGIVVNSPWIERSIERIDAEPLDLADIARFWKVYTTTKRRLLDPTAERLENYWWRIWGSRSRQLKGATVARLFAYISDGQSFVPLRGPSNRDEGDGRINSTSREGPAASSTTAIHRPSQTRANTTSSAAIGGSSVSTQRPAGILKNAESKRKRGPSTGSRSTPHVSFPHESQEDDDGSSISPNSHVVVQPPSPIIPEVKVEKKSTSSNGKKKGVFVASKGKRPVMVRRQSSQSSTDSPQKSADALGLQSSSDRTPPTFEQAQGRGKQRSHSKFQENFSPDPERPQKSTSKRSLTPDRNRRSPQKNTSHQRVAKGASNQARSSDKPGDPGPSTRSLRDIENGQVTEDDLTPEELEELEVQRLLLAEANARVQKSSRTPSELAHKEGFQILHSSLKSRSEGEQASEPAVRHVASDHKSSAIQATNLTDASGHFESNANSKDAEPSTKQEKGKGKDSETGGMFAKRPVQPVSPASVPDALSRSKSQLTLLLEKDRAKSIDNSSKDNKGRRHD